MLVAMVTVPGKPAAGHNLGLALVLLGVEHLVLDAAQLEHAAHQLRDFHRRGTYQHGRPASTSFWISRATALYFSRTVLYTWSSESLRLMARLVGNHHHVELVDFPELAGFGFGRAGHAGQLVVHAEVVLQRHRGVGLGGVFHAHVFLGLDGLVQAVGVAAAFHDAAGLLVHDFHLAVVGQDVLVVLLKQRVSFQKLVHGVHPLAFLVVVAHQLFF
jgi:hypothetical protein